MMESTLMTTTETENLSMHTTETQPPDGTDRFPELMVERELVEFLRIPAVSHAEDPHHVVLNLRRARGLPAVHLCRQPLYWKPAIRKWLESQQKVG